MGRRTESLIGKKFGDLTVIAECDDRPPNKEVVWLCKCLCGKEKKVRGQNLRGGRTKSCGCFLKGRLPGSTGEIPEELNKVNSVVVQDGLFQVFENGRIFRIEDFGKVECPQQSTNKYKTVSGNVNGKQKHFYVHRLLAEAFLPNPEEKQQVNHKDGDRSNNDLENLEWVTAQENVNHAYKTGLAHAFMNGSPCDQCGNPTRAKDNICPECKQKINSQFRKDITVNKIIESVEHIDVSLLTQRQKEIVELRRSGKTYEEIGTILGITRQGVESSLKTSERRMKNSGTISKTELNEITRLNKRKNRLEFKKEKLLNELYFLEKDLERVESSLLSFVEYRELAEV